MSRDTRPAYPGAGLQLASPIRPASRTFVEQSPYRPDGHGMRNLRITVSSFAVLAMAAASLSTATAAPAAHAPRHPAKREHVSLHESVKAAGAYDVTVRVTSHAGSNHRVQLRIGHIVRRTTTASRTHRATVTQRIAVVGRRLTVRASAQHAAPTIYVTWHK